MQRKRPSRLKKNWTKPQCPSSPPPDTPRPPPHWPAPTGPHLHPPLASISHITEPAVAPTSHPHYVAVMEIELPNIGPDIAKSMAKEKGKRLS